MAGTEDNDNSTNDNDGGTGSTGAPTKTFTQDEVNAFVAAERHKGSEKIGALTKERDDLAAFKQGADKFKADAEKEIASTKLAATKYRVGLDKGLPLPVAERLVGDDEESLAKDADTLAELLKKPGDGAGKLAGGPSDGGAPDTTQDMNARIRAAAGRGR